MSDVDDEIFGNANVALANRPQVTSKNRNARRREEAPSRSYDPGCSKNSVYYFQSFAENASIDGLKFLGEKGRTLIERIFWAIILTISIGICMYLVVKTFEKWRNSPVLVSFATRQTPVYDIPFPAVTICPEIKSDKARFNYTDLLLKRTKNVTLSDTQLNEFDYMTLICQVDPQLLNDDQEYIGEEVVDFFKELMPPVSDVIALRKWRDNILTNSVASIFFPILTSEGVCFTFNLLDKTELFRDLVYYDDYFYNSTELTSEWTPDDGYKKDASIDAYPRRTQSAGYRSGLGAFFYAVDGNVDHPCADFLEGYKVTIHHNTEMPRVRQNHFRVPFDAAVVVSVKPNIMTTAEELRSYSPEDRKCFFSNEKNLKFFKIYNQQNCLIECLTNFTLRVCGCVNFHMPREKTTKICGAGYKACMDIAEDMFLVSEVSDKLRKEAENKTTYEEIDEIDYDVKCNCLPSCYSINYDVEISQADWKWMEMAKFQQSINTSESAEFQSLIEDKAHFSRLTIYFKDMQFMTSERNELYSYVDFWANIGGTVGLFTGFSFVTMFEIIYYLSLRFFCNVRMFGRPYWSGDADMLQKAGVSAPKIVDFKCL